MTIAELIEMLTEAQETLGAQADVVIGDQPAWPFEYTIQAAVIDQSLGKLVLTEGSQLGYGKKAWWETHEGLGVLEADDDQDDDQDEGDA